MHTRARAVRRRSKRYLALIAVQHLVAIRHRNTHGTTHARATHAQLSYAVRLVSFNAQTFRARTKKDGQTDTPQKHNLSLIAWRDW